MAKISARGDKETSRWRKPNGAYIVATQHGRLLAQAIKGDGYSLVLSGKAQSVLAAYVARQWPDAEKVSA